MQYIIWDQKDGWPTRNEEGGYTTAGILGILGPDNVYLTTYADYGDNKRHTELDLNEWTTARFRLSGESKEYRIYRVA